MTLIDQNERFVFKPLLYDLVAGTAKEWEVAPYFQQLLAPYNISFLQVGRSTSSALVYTFFQSYNLCCLSSDAARQHMQRPASSSSLPAATGAVQHEPPQGALGVELSAHAAPVVSCFGCLTNACEAPQRICQQHTLARDIKGWCNRCCQQGSVNSVEPERVLPDGGSATGRPSGFCLCGASVHSANLHLLSVPL